MTIVVLGAGIVGLTTAVVLAEQGSPVLVLAADLPDETTSAVAGAIWGPYRVGPPDRVAAWGGVGLTALGALARQAGSGVRMGVGTEAATYSADPPWWSRLLPQWRLCEPHELPMGTVTGWRYCAPLIDMPTHLTYLAGRLTAANGRLQRMAVSDLDDVPEATVVVNCTGLGAGSLVGDPTLRPVRGQHVVVGNPGLREFLMVDVGPSNRLVGIFPHGDRVVLGGTAIEGVDDRSIDTDAADEIVERCGRYFPALTSAPVLAHLVGVRPVRPTVRLEAQRLESGRWCVHNYGHGGAGVSLAWGCAYEVARLVRDLETYRNASYGGSRSRG